MPEVKTDVVEAIRNRIDDRIKSAARKRGALGRNLNRAKFARIVFGVSSISFVSLSAFSELSDSLKFVFTLLALVSTSIATFSSDILNAFGFSDRYAQNVKILGDLQNLRAELDLEILLIEGGGEYREIDYWKYHGALIQILNVGNLNWNANIERNRG